jgi:hypothetical protein
VLFARFPAGIRSNNAVRSSPDRNLREQRRLFNCRQEPSKTGLNYAERVSMPPVLIETTEFMSRTQRIKAMIVVTWYDNVVAATAHRDRY